MEGIRNPKVSSICCLISRHFVFSQCATTLDEFERFKTLGTGSFGRVMLVRHKGRNQFYAMKILDKQKVSLRRWIKIHLKELLQIQHIGKKWKACKAASCTCRCWVSDERKWSASSRALLAYCHWKPRGTFTWEFRSLNNDVKVVKTGLHVFCVLLLVHVCSLERSGPVQLSVSIQQNGCNLSPFFYFLILRLQNSHQLLSVVLYSLESETKRWFTRAFFYSVYSNFILFYLDCSSQSLQMTILRICKCISMSVKRLASYHSRY